MMEKQHTAVIKKCTGCGRYNTEPQGNNKHGEPFLSCCPDSNYKEVTAVEWLKQKLLLSPKPIYNSEIEKYFEQAKQMEREQIEQAYKAGSEDCGEWFSVPKANEPNASDYYTQTYGE